MAIYNLKCLLVLTRNVLKNIKVYKLLSWRKAGNVLQNDSMSQSLNSIVWGFQINLLHWCIFCSEERLNQSCLGHNMNLIYGMYKWWYNDHNPLDVNDIHSSIGNWITVDFEFSQRGLIWHTFDSCMGLLSLMASGLTPFT